MSQHNDPFPYGTPREPYGVQKSEPKWSHIGDNKIINRAGQVLKRVRGEWVGVKP